MSFYRNFRTKEAILDYKLSKALQTIYDGAHFMDLSQPGPILLEEFRYIAKNSDFLKMINDRGEISLLYKWWDFFARKFLAEHDPTANPYEYAFYSGASINVIIRWIEGGLKESPEQSGILRCLNPLPPQTGTRGKPASEPQGGKSL
jgi:hypothetical protein